MNTDQIVTLSLFQLDGFAAKWWGFKSMQFGHIHFRHIDGLSFYKLLGSGGGNGFSLKPNFGTYGLLCVWDTEAQARDFFSNNSFFLRYRDKSSKLLTIYLQTIQSHGSWSGKQPFVNVVQGEVEGGIAVITRATIKFRYLCRFWREVPSVSASIDEAVGRVMSIGIGEWPIIQQATFSIWENSEQMMAYAYRSKLHNEVIKKTRELGWYSEELFARFRILKTEGAWKEVDL